MVIFFPSAKHTYHGTSISYQGCVHMYKVILIDRPWISVFNNEHQQKHGSRAKLSPVLCTSERSHGTYELTIARDKYDRETNILRSNNKCYAYAIIHLSRVDSFVLTPWTGPFQIGGVSGCFYYYHVYRISCI